MRNYLIRARLGSTRSVLAGVAAATAIALVAPSAQAELLTFGTNTTPGFFGFAAAPVDINGPGLAGTSLTFAGCIPGTPVMITYSAECSHSGTLAQWGTIQILLNGVVLSPTNAPPVLSDDAFCSGNATVGVHDGLATQSMEVVGRCRAGANVVAVTARSAFAGTTLRLDDMSTVVDR